VGNKIDVTCGIIRTGGKGRRTVELEFGRWDYEMMVIRVWERNDEKENDLL